MKKEYEVVFTGTVKSHIYIAANSYEEAREKAINYEVDYNEFEIDEINDIDILSIEEE